MAVLLDRIALFRREDFQQFFSVLMTAEEPQFQAVDGSGGDRGADGLTVSGDAIYQMYAPDRREAASIRKKIDDSLGKAVERRNTTDPGLRRFIFATPFNVTPDQWAYLRDGAQAAGFEPKAMGETDLLVLLGRHPEVRAHFPNLLMPDLVKEVRRLRASVDQVQQDQLGHLLRASQIERISWPEIMLLQAPDKPNTQLRAFETFTLYVGSERLLTESLEPADEDRFMDLVRERFEEDHAAAVSDRGAVHVEAENQGDGYRFDRKWLLAATGFVGMGSTLTDLFSAGHYSLADLAYDVLRALRFAAYLAGDGEVVVKFHYWPLHLKPRLETSDVRVARVGGQVAGVTDVRHPETQQNYVDAIIRPALVEDLAVRAHELAAQLIVPFVRQYHGARVDTAAFAESVLSLSSAYVRGARL